MSFLKPFQLLAIVIVLSLSACGSGTDTQLKRLNNAVNKWNSFNLENYHITSRRSCFCMFYQEVRVIVENDQVSEAFYTQTGEYLVQPELGYLLTVNQHFEIIRGAIASNAFQLDVEYDETYGFPTQISIDYVENVADDEITYTLSNLQ